MLLQGIAMQSILHAMVEQGGPPEVDFDFVLVVGHFLTRDENIFTFFEARLLPAFCCALPRGMPVVPACPSDVLPASSCALPEACQQSPRVPPMRLQVTCSALMMIHHEAPYSWVHSELPPQITTTH